MAKQHDLREKALFFLYQTFLRQKLNLGYDREEYDLLAERFQEAIEIVFNQYDELVELIEDELVDWEFDRLGYIEQAILLLSCGEVIALKTPKSVVINEAVDFAKKYGDKEDTYKLINATLDKVLNV